MGYGSVEHPVGELVEPAVKLEKLLGEDCSLVFDDAGWLDVFGSVLAEVVEVPGGLLQPFVDGGLDDSRSYISASVRPFLSAGLATVLGLKGAAEEGSMHVGSTDAAEETGLEVLGAFRRPVDLAGFPA